MIIRVGKISVFCFLIIIVVIMVICRFFCRYLKVEVGVEGWSGGWVFRKDSLWWGFRFREKSSFRFEVVGSEN